VAIAITGASGHLGQATAREAADLAGGADGFVLATRNPGAVAGLLPGASARFADFDQPESLLSAFTGVSRLLLISTSTVDNRAAQHRAAIDAARLAGVELVVYTSVLSPGPGNPALIADSHWATEEYLRASGLAFTILRCGLYADFQVFEAAEAIESGRFVHNRGTGGCSYVARDDCARVAAAVLVGDGHESATYEVTGPASLDGAALAALYGDVGGTAIEEVQVTDDEFLQLLSGGESTDGHVQYGAALTVSLGQAIRDGHFAATTTTVQDLTGAAPRSVGQLLADSAERLRSLAAGRT
jgi:NAD(P)H dehydrogenase (quinone)